MDDDGRTDFDTMAMAWFGGLTPEERAEMRDMIGRLMEWMVDGLRAAGIQPIPFEMAAGVQGYLMPTALMDFLSAA